MRGVTGVKMAVNESITRSVHVERIWLLLVKWWPFGAEYCLISCHVVNISRCVDQGLDARYTLGYTLPQGSPWGYSPG